MQTALSRRCQGAIKPLDRRSVARVPAFGTTTSRRTSVQVFAKGKGKGKTAFRQGSMPGQMETIRQEAPTPEVDPENEEIVVFMRCLKYTDPTLNVKMGPSMWVPINIVKGNQVTNYIVRQMGNKWFSRLYSRLLIWSIASTLYKERVKLEKEMRKRIPIFAKAASSDFEYALKIRDKSRPKDWLKAEGLTVLPDEAALSKLGIEQIKEFFSAQSLASMFKGPEEQAPPSVAPPSSSTPAQQ